MPATSRSSVPSRRTPPRSASLLVEQLEDRSVPSTFTVLNLNNFGAGSLRAAVASANANPDADVIRFANGLHGTIALTSQLSITEDVSIKGFGASKITVSGGDVTRVFNISGSTTDVSLAGLTVAHGYAAQGAGIDNAGGAVSVSDCRFVNNRAVAAAGLSAYGGGIFNEAGGTLTVKATTFTGNRALGGDGGGGAGGYGVGGGIENQGVASIDHSVFTGNLARGGSGTSGVSGADGFGLGGAIDNEHGGTLTVRSSTLTSNTARGGG